MGEFQGTEKTTNYYGLGGFVEKTRADHPVLIAKGVSKMIHLSLYKTGKIWYTYAK